MVFDLESVYQNMYYVMVVGKNFGVPLEIRRSFPWIIWILWKNRNNLIFEGKRFLATETIAKVKEDTFQWFHAQSMEKKNKRSHIS